MAAAHHGGAKRPVDIQWPPFNPFVRHPTSLLGKVKMGLLGPVLVPLRVVLTLVTLLLLWLWMGAMSIGADPSVPYGPRRRFFTQAPLKLAARMLMFCAGIVRVEESHLDGKGNRRPGMPAVSVDREGRPVKPHAVVGNHIGMLDILIVTSRYGCTFVSKAQNKNLPFIGTVATAVQCIWLDREHSSSTGDGSAGSTTARIVERMTDPPGTWPPLALFPEGTTTNGRTLIHWRTGAFVAGQPVQPVACRMPFNPTYGYDPSFTAMNLFKFVLGLWSQLRTHCELIHLPVYVPNEAEKKDPQLFANNVRKLVADTLGAEVCELEWPHKLQFEPGQAKRAMGRRMLADRNGGKVPPAPVFTEDFFGNPLPAKVGKKVAASKKGD